MADDLRTKVQAVLATIRPLLQADGGDVELVDLLPDGTVNVKLKGACGGCPMSRLTLKRGIESRVKQAVPEVKSVEAI
jgi:Fe-S cluster biogenesis protein NfuA